MSFSRTLVMKFGGASVSTAQSFASIADLIVQKSDQYQQIAVVVSAMGNTTDELLDLAKKVHPSPPSREQDMLVSTGERVSISLLAMALDLKGKEAMSFTGSQSGIITSSEHTEAKIVEVKPFRLLKCFELGKIAIVAGFQGVSRFGEITTLGRGGSDTTAVALGAALRAEKVEFYKDVKGIYDFDPKIDLKASLFDFLSFEKALEMTLKGAKILHHRAVELAAKNHLPLHVMSFDRKENSCGTLIGIFPRSQFAPVLYEEVS